MELPVNLLMWIMAAFPIVLLILLMVKFQWGAAEAAPIGLWRHLSFPSFFISLILN